MGRLSFRKNFSPRGAGITLKVRGDIFKLKKLVRSLAARRSAKLSAPSGMPKLCSINRRMLPKS